MAQRTPQLWENDGFRGLLLAGVAMALLVWLFDFPATATALMGLIVGTSGLYDLLDGRYGLPEGSNWVFYGTGVLLAGTVAAALGALWGAAFVVAGGWFVLDGAATVRAGSGREPHEYADGIDDESNSEAMLRMQVLGSVHEELREAEGPRTPGELADALGLAEERTAPALDFLETRGQVERVDDERYRAVEPRWGRAQPAVSFLRWLPRRLARPFRLLLG